MSIPSEVREERKYAVKEAVKPAVEFVSDRPLTAVVIAAALGFIIAQVIF